MSDAANPRNPNTAYERADVRLLPLLVVAIGVVVLLGVAPLLIRALWPGTRGDVDRHLAIQPPAPRLQTSPPTDLAAYLAREQALLDSYGWVDRGKGIAREPIAAAIQQLVHGGIDGLTKQQATK